MTERKPGKSFFVLILLAFPPLMCLAQSLNYSEVFGNDWQKALTFTEKNDIWIKPALEKFNIPYHEAIAVVFPELVRYSAIRDKMEITLLKTLYRNLGDQYADFSVGEFQVKPSCAEMIRKALPVALGNKSKELFAKRTSYKNEYQFRVAIITDLENPGTEFNYIIAFYLICQKRFDLEKMDEIPKIKFLATAYNSGFWKSKKDILKMEEKKFFNTKLFKTDNYSYADVALFWYNNYFKTDGNK